MKDRKKFLEYMTLLGELYNRKISKVLLEAYWQSLKDIPDESAISAFEMSIKTLKYFPKPSELIELARGSPEDLAQLAWVKVSRAIRTIGSYDSVIFEDKVIHSVVIALGGWIKLCMLPERDLKWLKKEFLRLYEVCVNTAMNHPDRLVGKVESENKYLGYADDIPKPIMVDKVIGKTLPRVRHELIDNDRKLLSSD